MGVSIDMLSWLPDSLLTTIVSSLTFKEAVRTSILSKNWVNICKSTTNIEFNELFFVKYDNSLDIIDAQRRAFSDFTKKWIQNCDQSVIEKFSLSLTLPDIYVQLIDRCLTFALSKGVKHLEIDFTYPTWMEDNFYYDIYVAMVELPRYVYAYSGIESLKLYSCNFIASEVVNFHSLKEISLGYMRLRLFAIKALLTNCKKLESLSFYKCWNSDDDFDLKEEYLGLKKLVINRCHFKFNILRINAPNLKVFNYHGLMTLFVIDIRSPGLEKVNLDFSLEHGSQGHGHYLYQFLCQLAPAQVLMVCSYLLQVIYTGGRPKRMYRNMNVKHMIMKTALHHHEFMGIAFMLNSCPKLEHLTIEMCDRKVLLGYEPMFTVDPDTFWVETAKLYKCVRINLKEVVIKGFKGTKNEFNVINYFVVRARNLKKMSIEILKDEKVATRRQAAELLLMSPKASNNLEISIY